MLLWPVLVVVVSVRFLGRQPKAGMLLGLLVGGMVEVLVETAAEGLSGVLTGVPEMGHLEVGAMTGVLLGMQLMNGGPVQARVLLQQLPLRLMTLIICLVVSLLIHTLQRQLLLQLLPELLLMEVHVPWLLL